MNDEFERQHNLERILHSPSYRVASQDVDFLDDPQMRATRIHLELLKPELAFQKQNIVSTIVAFGGTRITEPRIARQRLEDARARSAEMPGDPGRLRAVNKAERLAAKSGYYDVARRFAALVSSKCQEEWGTPIRDGHRRGAGHHGGGQSRGLRRTGEIGGTEHPPPLGTTAQSVHHARSLLPVPLLRDAEVPLHPAHEGAGGFPRRIRHVGRASSRPLRFARRDGCRKFPSFCSAASFGRKPSTSSSWRTKESSTTPTSISFSMPRRRNRRGR